MDVAFTLKCRCCPEVFNYGAFLDPQATGADVELMIHESLDDEGWADGLCQQCVQNLPVYDTSTLNNYPAAPRTDEP